MLSWIQTQAYAVLIQVRGQPIKKEVIQLQYKKEESPALLSDPQR
jgi:hypothetical protein